MELFENPNLIDNVKVLRFEATLACHVNDKEIFYIEFDDLKKAQEMHAVSKLFNGVNKLSDICSKHIGLLSESEISDFTGYLQEENVLIDGKLDAQNYSGINAIQLLSNYFFNILAQELAVKDNFSKPFHEGALPKECVIGFALQHYHVTRLCEASIANACAIATSPRHKTLTLEFLVDEHQHYKMMEKSLVSLGLSSQEIATDMPLPATQAYMDMLFALSKKDFLGYATTLFVYEGDIESSLKHQKAITSYGFSEEFTKPQIHHEQINQEGDHYGVSKDIFREIAAITHNEYERLELIIRRVAFTRLSMLNQVYSHYQTAPVKARTLSLDANQADTFSKEVEKSLDTYLNKHYIEKISVSDIQNAYQTFLCELLDCIVTIVSGTEGEESREFSILLNGIIKGQLIQKTKLSENQYFCLLNMTDCLYRICHHSKEDFLSLTFFIYKNFWLRYEKDVPYIRKHEEVILKILDRLNIGNHHFVKNPAHLGQIAEQLAMFGAQLTSKEISSQMPLLDIFRK